jgi:hypothetical protein
MCAPVYRHFRQHRPVQSRTGGGGAPRNFARDAGFFTVSKLGRRELTGFAPILTHRDVTAIGVNLAAYLQ